MMKFQRFPLAVRMAVRAGVIGMLTLGAAGCASGPCTGNPLTDNISCVQSGINTGQYQRRVEERQTEAQEKQRQVEAAKAENERLQGQIADAKVQEQSLRAKLAAQRTELDRLADQINRQAGQGQLSPGESSLRRAQVDYLRQRQAALQQQGSENRERQQKAAALQHEIDELKAALEKSKI
jgi:peptidoglycan hydrolase CwlO-like protein